MGRRAKPARGKKDAKRPRAGKSPKDESSRVLDLEQRLAESLEREKVTGCALTEAEEQRTATAEILRVISQSPTDVQPVFDTIIRSAVRLCDGLFGALYQFDGELLHLVAQHNYTSEALEAAYRVFPGRPTRGGGPGRAILDRAVAHIPDLQLDLEHRYPMVARAVGWRSGLFVPMLREGAPIGVIAVTRARVEPRPFSNSEIELLQTFADQAIIAVENVRLFKELEARNHDLTESLEQQTATAEILRAISGSATDVQPVFTVIAENATRLSGALFGSVQRFDGELIHEAALHNYPPAAREFSRRHFPTRPSRESFSGRAMLDRIVVHVSDVAQDRDRLHAREIAEVVGFRSVLSVPMLREGSPLGAITVFRDTAGPFSDKQIALLQTFADQAVIAIENVRLFTELQASNRELTTALDTQTATSDILRVISRAQTDVQPVFDAILASAVRLLGAYSGMLTRVAGDQIVLAALTGTDAAAAAVRVLFPQPLQSLGPYARAMLDGAPFNSADAQTDVRVPEFARAAAQARGFRSWVVVPMLRHDEALGTISVTRREPAGSPTTRSRSSRPSRTRR